MKPTFTVSFPHVNHFLAFEWPLFKLKKKENKEKSWKFVLLKETIVLHKNIEKQINFAILMDMMISIFGFNICCDLWHQFVNYARIVQKHERNSIVHSFLYINIK